MRFARTTRWRLTRDRPTWCRSRIAALGHDRCGPVLLARDLVTNALPLARTPTLCSRHERGVLTEQHERGKSLEPETVDERALGVAPSEPAVDRVTEDALGDRRGRRYAHDRAHVAVAERREDAVDHGDERRALGPIRQHDQGDVEDRRPIVECARDALVARDRQER